MSSLSVDITQKLQQILEIQTESSAIQFTKQRHLAISPTEENLEIRFSFFLLQGRFILRKLKKRISSFTL